MEEVNEPSDIIWENMAKSKRTIGKNKIKVYCAMFFILMVTLCSSLLVDDFIRSVNSSWNFKPL